MYAVDPNDRAVVIDDRGNNICICLIPVHTIKDIDNEGWAYNNARLIAEALNVYVE